MTFTKAHMVALTLFLSVASVASPSADFLRTITGSGDTERACARDLAERMLAEVSFGRDITLNEGARYWWYPGSGIWYTVGGTHRENGTDYPIQVQMHVTFDLPNCQPSFYANGGDVFVLKSVRAGRPMWRMGTYSRAAGSGHYSYWVPPPRQSRGQRPFYCN